MRKVILIVLGVVAAAVLVFAVVVAIQPKEFRVVRSATINAKPAAVFAHVNDFHAWKAWSPWLELDPDVKETYEGPAAGEGASYQWVGNDKIGKGGMKILESHPSDKIVIDLSFEEPMQDTAKVQFDFEEADQSTKVTWTMHGENTFVEKAFCMFMNMDKMVGGDFEKGLAKLKAAVEKDAKPSGEES